MTFKEKLSYEHVDEKYNHYNVLNEYEIKLVDDKLVSVRNEFLFEVDKKSYVWDYFYKKYSK